MNRLQEKNIKVNIIPDVRPYIITLVQGMALEDDRRTRMGIANAILDALKELKVDEDSIIL